MARTSTYHTSVSWTGGHRGRMVMGNGPEFDFSAPPDAHGHADVVTPEDAFVGALNTCVMLMFLWACERFKLDLLSYECRGEGTKLVELDRTETFTELRLYPVVRLRRGDDTAAEVEKRAERALLAARKFSLVANSVKSKVLIDPQIEVVEAPATSPEPDLARGGGRR